MVAMLAVGPIAILPSPLLAAIPTNAPFTVTNGTATWVGSGTLANITASDRSVLVWNGSSFNIAAGEIFSFQVAGGSVLNKVGYDTTTGALGTPADAVINGTLTGTGRVFILANGNILVGGGASIQSTGGVFLSTLSEADTFSFTTSGNLNLTGSNLGSIVLGNNTTLANVIGNVSAYSSTVTANTLTVNGDMIVNTASGTNGAVLTGTGGATTVTGNLSVTTNGAITQNATTGVLVVSNTANFNTSNSTAGSVTLTNPNNNFGTVTVNAVGNPTAAGANVSLTDVSGIILGTSAISGNLTVNANGNITTSGAVSLTNTNGNKVVSLTTTPNTGLINFGTGSNLNNNTINASAFGNSVVVDVVGNATIGNLATGGTVGSPTITNAGAGYVAAPTVTVSSPGVTGATGTATVNTTTGVVTGVSISVPAGQFLSATPTTITLTGGGNVTATANASVASGAITSLAIATGGLGYTSAPTVVISGGGGTGATADAVISGGAVTAFILNNAGSGYTSAPTITLVGGGANPTTTATVTQNVVAANSPITVNATGTATIAGNLIANGANITVTAPVIAQGSNYIGAGNGANVLTMNATAGNLTVGNLRANSVTLTAGAGNISQTAGTITTPSTTSTISASGNIALTGNNAFGGSTLVLTGNQVSVTNSAALTLSNSTSTGNMTINTTPSTFGGGAVTLGAGIGSAAKGVTVGGALNISTNGSNVSDDNYAAQSVLGAITINTAAAGYGVLSTLNVTNGGSGYVNAPQVTVLNGSGATATASVSGGVVTGFAVTSAGTGGFNAAPTLSLLGGGAPTTAASSITPVLTSTIVTSIPAPGVAGAGYVVAPTVTISGGGGSGATATAQINSLTGTVTGFTITNGGIGYTSAPTVTLLGGGNPTAVATNSGTIANGGTVSLTAATGAFGARTTYGQFNVTSNTVTINETQTINLGNISANSLTVNSTAANIVFTGNTTANTVSANANAGGISQVGALAIASTSNFRSGNAFSTVLENPSNSFGGAVTLTQGLNNIIVSGSNFSLAAATCLSAANGTTTIRTVDTVNNTITILGGNASGTTGLTANSAGNIVVSGGTFRNMTLTAANNITQTAGFGSNATITLQSGGNVVLNNASNNLTTVVLNNTVGDTAVFGNRSLTVSGVTGGNLSVRAGVANGTTITSFANPWNLVLGNIEAKSISAEAQNGTGTTAFLTNGNSGTVTQVAGSKLRAENGASFTTTNGDIIIANNGNNFGAVSLSTQPGTGSTANITFVEDATLKVSSITTTGNSSITSRFGSIIEDSAAAVNINSTGTSTVLSLSAPSGSVSLGGLTNNNTTFGNVVAANITALGAAAIKSSGNITLGSTSANSLSVISGNHIAQSAPLKVFASSSFNATNSITLTNAENNFGPVALTTQSANQSIAITEGSSLNLRTVSFPGAGNGTFTATSVSGDIIDTGLGGVKPAGTVVSPGSGVITLTAANGNIILDDPTTDLPSTAGIVFNGKNVTLSVLGQPGSNLVLGAANTTSSASGNLTATSALGNIGNAGAMSVSGTALFQTGNGNITIAQPNVGFGSLRFIGNQVNISESGNMDILTGSTAYGTAQLVSGGSIAVTDQGGVVSFGNTVAMQAAGNITLTKLQAVGTIAVTATGTKDLSALSLSADLNSKTPVFGGAGANVDPKP